EQRRPRAVAEMAAAGTVEDDTCFRRRHGLNASPGSTGSPRGDTVRADGSERQPIGPGAEPDWSPDGLELAFNSASGVSGGEAGGRPAGTKPRSSGRLARLVARRHVDRLRSAWWHLG